MIRQLSRVFYPTGRFLVQNSRRLASTSGRRINVVSMVGLAGALGGFAAYSLYSTPNMMAEGEPELKNPAMECQDPACHDSQEMFHLATEAVKRKAVKQPAAYTQRENEFTVKDKNGKIHECPPSRELLGRHSWTLLHSIAAYYPDNPTEEDKKYAREFIESFSHLYPCKVCAQHLQKSLKKYPPNVNSRKEFMIYLCTLHNIVNRTLLKPVYPCNIELLEERWRTGCPECWSSNSSRKMTSEESMDCKDMHKFGVKSGCSVCLIPMKMCTVVRDLQSCFCIH